MRRFFKKKPKVQESNYLKREFSDVADFDDIYGCFRLILGRPPAPEEWSGHKALAGRPLVDVVNTYVSSKEFKARSLDYLDLSKIAQVAVRGFDMMVPTNDPQVGIHIYERQGYEEQITDFISAFLPQGGGFLDIGANIGYFSLLAASIVGSQGKVIAYEPGTTNVKFLTLNKALNSFEQLDVLPVAASDEKGLLLYDSSGSNGFIGELNEDVKHIFGSSLVYSIPVDDACNAMIRLDIIKIDVEGAEYLSLKGASKTIQKFQPIIISEFSPPALMAVSKVKPESYLKYILELADYFIYCVSGSGLVPCYKDIDKVIDMFSQSGADHIDIVFAKPDQYSG